MSAWKPVVREAAPTLGDALSADRITAKIKLVGTPNKAWRDLYLNHTMHLDSTDLGYGGDFYSVQYEVAQSSLPRLMATIDQAAASANAEYESTVLPRIQAEADAEAAQLLAAQERRAELDALAKQFPPPGNVEN
ncbi:hypothetical protein [Nocardia neocaledoniensis]|uniref:hypothetical protein n=1 Tax=Nocardia neocaledoniensis TaxID=236511 RepID=UPI002456077A|nr:hypothetical protein [Nocardia neocaledoniensis]